MTDTSPEALDALEKRLRRTPLYEGSGEGSDLPEEAADTIAALRAAPVAMRERAEGAALHEADLLKQRAAEADDAGHDTAADFYRESEQTARNIAALIRALPLDAPAPVDPAWDRVAQGVFHEVPAPVDPVAEAARLCATEGCPWPAAVYFEAGNVGSYHCQECWNKIAAHTIQEARHD
jgi:hypothetical protein